MKKIIFIILSGFIMLPTFAMGWFWNSPTLHVCTVASYKNKGFHQLIESCQKNDIKIDVLGMNLPYKGLSDKLIYMREYLSALPDDDIVLFVDAFDVVFLTGQDVILRKFLAMNTPLVFSVERSCACVPKLGDKYPKGPTSFRYLNSGTYIGYVWAIKDLLKDLGSINPKDNDQVLLSKHYLEHPEKYCFDYYCELFLPLCLVKEAELIVDSKKGSIKCIETKTETCMIHGNGRGRPIYQRLYDYLFLGIEDRYGWKTSD